MATSASLSAQVQRTPIRGWAVILLFWLQQSSIILNSFTFGLFLPFITEDLDLSLLEAGALQGVWWGTSALLTLPFGAWFSRFRPVPLVLASLLLGLPFVFLQGAAVSFLMLFFVRFFLVMFTVINAPAQSMLLQQWAARRHYALANGWGLFQHSVLLATAVSTSALIIAALGSWRLGYFVLGGFMVVQTVLWLVVARERHAPVKDLQAALEEQRGTPLRAIRAYPQVWLLGITMFALAATWTSVVTFLPTFMLEERGVSLAMGGTVLGFLYYALIPGALVGGYFSRKVTNRKLLLWIPALLNMLFGVGLALTPSPLAMMALLTGIGMVWMVSPALQVLPFEFPGIRPREVAVITSLVMTLMGLGFATGPVVTGLVAQLTGSLQMGLVVLALMTGVGVVSGLLYPRHQRGRVEASTAAGE